MEDPDDIVILEAEGGEDEDGGDAGAGACCGVCGPAAEGDAKAGEGADASSTALSYGKILTNLGAVALILVAYLGIGEDPVIPNARPFVRWGLLAGSVILGRVVSIQIVRFIIYCLDAYLGASSGGESSGGINASGSGSASASTSGSGVGADAGASSGASTGAGGPDDAEDGSARILYFLLALRLPVRVAVWVAIIIGCWALYFGEPNLLLNAKHYPGVPSATYTLVLRILLAFGVFSLLWIVEMWILKSLSVRLYRNTFWEQMRSSIRLEFMLRALSTSVPGRVPHFKVREADAAKAASGEAAAASVGTLHTRFKRSLSDRGVGTKEAGALEATGPVPPRRVHSGAGLPAMSPLPKPVYSGAEAAAHRMEEPPPPPQALEAGAMADQPSRESAEGSVGPDGAGGREGVGADAAGAAATDPQRTRHEREGSVRAGAEYAPGAVRVRRSSSFSGPAREVGGRDAGAIVEPEG